jgi:GcvH upstream region-like protein
MLAFFRKYQRFFYIVVTIVIVISFSFFGALSTTQNPEGDMRSRSTETVFVAVDGSKIPWRDLEALALFIGTDNEDKLLMGGRWGPNFLNDGVIKKDFLETGIAEQLAASFQQELLPDLKARQQREKGFQFYQHPQAKFLSAENAWEAVAPNMNALIAKMKAPIDLSDPQQFNESFKDRVQLYLAERHFPDPSLRMVLRHQQKQYQWITQDPALERADLALFSYHTLDDWFSPVFTRLVAIFIINSAKIAEKQGYVVSKEEVLADLYHNAQISFEQQAQNPYLNVVSGEDYLREQLHRMGLQEGDAADLWRQVMLFRRLFHDLGGSVLVDPLTIGELHDYAKETVAGDLYRLPEPLWLGDFRKLQLFETYLDAVGERPSKKSSLLALPKKFKSVETIASKNPELVEKRYALQTAQVKKRDLQAKIGVKETWIWEVKDSSWEKLKKQFPELGIKKGGNEEERHQALSELDLKTRQRVDAFARAQIVEENPASIKEALEGLTLEKKMVFLRKKGKSPDFPGLKNTDEFIQLIEAYPENQAKLSQYSPDNEIYYRIVVEDRSSPYEVMTFQKALSSGVLEEILEKTLEAYYVRLREKYPERFQKKSGEGWKSFEEVRQQIGEEYFAPLVQEIGRAYSAHSGKENKKLIGDYAASLRFYPYMVEVQTQLKKDPKKAASLLKEKIEGQELGGLDEQWKVEKRPFTIDRSQPSAPFEPENLFQLSLGEWSHVERRLNGEIAFFHLNEKTKTVDQAGLYEKTMQVRKALSAEAERGLADRLLDEIKKKRAYVEKSTEV